MNIRNLIGAVGVITASFAPIAAFAVPLSITETTEDGSVVPATTIIIRDSAGNVIKEISHPGGDAAIEDIDVDEGQELVVSATADGYSIKSKKGTPSASGGTVKLVARKSTTIRVQLKEDGITDFSGVTAKLYAGVDTNGNPQASVETDASGIVKFEGVPSGEYTIIFDAPENLQGKIATSVSVTVPEDPNGEISVDASSGKQGAANSNDSSESTDSNGNGSDESKSSSKNITQTGDSSLMVLMGVGAAATIGTTIMRKIRG